MKPILIPLVLFALILHVQTTRLSGLMSFSSLENSAHTHINAYDASPSESSPDEIPIHKDLDGYYVNANLADPATSTSQDTVKMMLGLSSSDVLLIQQDCLGFKQYDCPHYHCNEIPEAQQTVNYPDFTAETIQASSAYVSLDNANWELKGRALLATSCSTGRNDDYDDDNDDDDDDDLKGTNRYGIIGLGTQGTSKDNFIKNKTFSISFTSDFKSGVLKFSKDDRYYFQKRTLKANANWVSPLKGFLVVNEFWQNFRANIAFDINAETIGFPPKLFKMIVKQIEKSQRKNNMTCTNDTYQPTCNFTGFISDLSDIRLVGPYPCTIGIEPEAYVKNATDVYVINITLNIQALNSSSSSGRSFVTSDYENTIILNARAMSPYYIVFNASGPTNTIDLYDASTIRDTGNSTSNNTNPNPEPNQGKSSKGPLLAGLIILISIAASCIIIKKCNNNGKTAATQGQAPVISVNNSTKIVNTAGVVEVNNNQYKPPSCNVAYIGQENQCL